MAKGTSINFADFGYVFDWTSASVASIHFCNRMCLASMHASGNWKQSQVGTIEKELNMHIVLHKFNNRELI